MIHMVQVLIVIAEVLGGWCVACALITAAYIPYARSLNRTPR